MRAGEKNPGWPETLPNGGPGTGLITAGMWVLAPVLFIATVVVLAAGFASMGVISLRDHLATWQGNREGGD